MADIQTVFWQIRKFSDKYIGKEAYIIKRAESLCESPEEYTHN
jgi:hypothetical protein